MELDPVSRLERDIVKAIRQAAKTGENEMRALCDSYYQMQRLRLACANQARALEETKAPHLVLDYLIAQSSILEQQLSRALAAYADSTIPGQWLLSVHGIGPVLAANFLAHLDITRANTAGAFWRFAGLDPSLVWGKGEKRPFNGALKVACWKAADSWVKNKGREE